MDKYLVEIQVLYVAQVEIEATSKREAVKRVADGEGDAVADSERFLNAIGPTGRAEKKS